MTLAGEAGQAEEGARLRVEGQAEQTLPGVDRLSLLPDELLDLVFSFAFDFDVLEPEAPLCTHLPLSKRLYRVQRDALYREVRLDSYSRFTSFAATVRANAVFGLAVRTFVVSIPWAREPGDLPTLEKAAPGSVNSTAVQAVLQSLPNLRELVLYGSSVVALSFLHWSVAPARLPHLERFEVDCTLPSLHDPFHPTHYLPLLAFHNLQKFVLYVRRCNSTIEDEHIPHLPIPPFHNLTAFTCQGPFRSTISLRRLFAALPNLESLSLREFGEFATPPVESFPSLLAALPNPGKLSALDFMGDDEGDIEYSNEFFSLLPMFPNLRELRLDGMLTASPVLYHALRRLPGLFTLDLCFGVLGVTTDDLVSLISKPRHATLGELFISTVSADHDMPAEWTDGFTFEGFGDLLDVADAQDVLVGGDAMDVFEAELEPEGDRSDGSEEGEEGRTQDAATDGL
ncbi:hypothetical protein JCM10213_002824 [Rhodosporidiobolus nylandii]